MIDFKSYPSSIWIVNDIIDSNNSVFCFRVLLMFQNSMCKEVCVSVLCVCVCLCVCMYLLIAVNSCACHIWIVNDITDCNTWLFSVLGFSFIPFWNSMCKVVVCVYMIRF